MLRQTAELSVHYSFGQFMALVFSLPSMIDAEHLQRRHLGDLSGIGEVSSSLDTERMRINPFRSTQSPGFLFIVSPHKIVFA